jgi:putative toxin-antitoxin system antitoxin component (TIGR02293 family)
MRHMAGKRASNVANGGLVLSLFRTTEADSIREQVEGGRVPARFAIDHLRDSLGLTTAEISFLLDASARTVERRLNSEANLTVAEGDRAYRAARITDLASKMLGDSGRAKEWLRAPSRYLGGKTPLAMLATEVGTHLVEQSLYAIGYGSVG